MATWKNSKGPVLVRDELEFSLDLGRRRVREFHGEKASIYGIVPSFERRGIAYKISKVEAGKYALTAVWQELTSEEAQVVWNLTTEVIQTHIFNFPAINTEIEASARPTVLRKAILNALEEGRDTIQDDFSDDEGGTYSQSEYPKSYIALAELRRGTEYFEEEVLVLRRRRSTSNLFNPVPMRIDLGRYIFSNDQLGIPNNVGFVLPNLSTLPTKPASQWGWRLRGHDSQFAEWVTEQNHEFVLASWSTNLYSIAPAPFQALST